MTMRINFIFKKLIFVILAIISIPFFVENVSAEAVYNLYTADGVTWQYAYIDDVGNERVEISFFQKDNSVTKATVPSITTLRSQAGSNIPTSVNTLTLVDYYNHNLGTPNPIVNYITEINLINVNNVNGVSPMVNTNTVTKIIFSPSVGTTVGNNVFTNAKLNIENLDKVTSIGVNAFRGVTLSNVDLDLDNLNSIDDGAFWSTNVKTLSINSPTIGYNAFRSSKQLVSVEFGDNVENVMDAAFRECSNLVTVNFNKVKILGNSSFGYNPSLTTNISNTQIESIGDQVFVEDVSITGVLSIPEKVTSLGYQAFMKTSITALNLNNVEIIKVQAFMECPNLSNVNFGKVKTIEYQAFYNNKKIESVKLTDSVIDIHTQAFSDCNISELDLNQIQKLEYLAFANNNLTELYLPKSFSFMQSYGLFENNPIEKVTVAYDTMSTTIIWIFQALIGSNYKDVKELILEAPYKEGEQAIINSAFGANHGGLKWVSSYDGSDVDVNPSYGNANNYKNVIQHSYFYGMTGLETIIIGEGYEFIGPNAFFYSDYMWETFGTPNFEALEASRSLKTVSLPSTLKGIGTTSFFGVIASPKTTINLPEGLEFIGQRAFMNCVSLDHDIDLPNLKYIGSGAFIASGIKSIYLHDSLEYFGYQPIHDCKELKTIIVDVDLWSIDLDGGGNFRHNIDNRNRYELIKFTEKVQTVPHLVNDSSSGPFMYQLQADVVDMEDVGWTSLTSQFFQGADIGTLKLPKGLITIGQLAFYKAHVDNVVELPFTIVNIDVDAFNSADLKINQIPENVQILGRGAFYNSEFCTDPVLPESVSSLGQGAFMGVVGSDIHINSFTFNHNLPPSYTSNYAIYDVLLNINVDHLIFGENVTELPSYSYTGKAEFDKMTVKTVTFANIPYLPLRAFIDCEYLTEVDFSQDSNLEYIDELAFYNTPNLKSVKFPNKDIVLKQSSFRNTGLESIGDSSAGIDLTSANFILDGYFVFADNSNLYTINIPNGFNDNIIPEYTFANCPNLMTATLGNELETIKSYAFSGDSNLSSIFLWGDTKIEQVNNKDKVINTKSTVKVYNFSSNPDLSFTLVDSAKGNSVLTPANFVRADNSYDYAFAGTGTVTFNYPDSVSIDILGWPDFYMVIITDNNPSNYTIPSNTDIYTYSNYDGSDWDKTYAEVRRNNALETDGQFYPLDEVLYLTSNNPKVKIKDNDFDKSDLIVYALRRDGVIMESAKWQVFSRHYSRKDVNIKFAGYDSNELNKALVIYDNPYGAKEADISTENFANMTFEITPALSRSEKEVITLYYTNDFLENSVVQTVIDPYVEEVIPDPKEPDDDEDPEKDSDEEPDKPKEPDDNPGSIIDDIIDIVKTGDNIILFVIILIASIIGVGVSVFIYKKAKKKMV